MDGTSYSAENRSKGDILLVKFRLTMNSRGNMVKRDKKLYGGRSRDEALMDLVTLLVTNWRGFLDKGL